jgi:hypothetical protein
MVVQRVTEIILKLVTLVKTVLLAPFQAALICVAMQLALLAESVEAVPADGIAVDVVNESEPVLCAEKDNVALSFASPEVRSFRIEAAHPIYLSSGHRNNWEPDWTACEMSDDPVYAAPHGQPRKVLLYREAGLQIFGHTFSSFWRPATAVVRIGDRVEKSLHLLQVHLRRAGHQEEVLVLYPQDGYWRARPLSPDHFGLRIHLSAACSSLVLLKCRVGRSWTSRRSGLIHRHAHSRSNSDAAGRAH